MGAKTGGRRGRPAKPVTLKLLQGNPGKRPLPEEIKVTTKKPVRPAFLDKDARKEWQRLIGPLYNSGVLTAAEQSIFAAYCQAYSRWVQAERKIQQLGDLVVKTRNGHQIPNPYLPVANKAMEQMRGFANELGLTPSARARINSVNDDSGKTKNPFELFLSGKKTS